MATNVTLFPSYSQAENRTTNYCLLLLKLLYEENPKFLGEALASLLGEEIGVEVGVRFEQQRRTGRSIPDGLVVQSAFALHIETKLGRGVGKAQLQNHIDGLAGAPGTRVMLALANFETDPSERLVDVKAYAEEKGVFFCAATFDELLTAVDREELPKNLADAVEDFRGYLDEENLLPTWRTILDVCNCAGKPEEQTLHNAYFCPATGGAYRHRRSRFFGMYRNKKVECVAKIEAVVDLEPGFENATILWKNVEEDDARLEERARFKALAARPHVTYPLRVFVLGPLYPLEKGFVKETKGGMIGSKQYFNIESLKPEDAEHLARGLNGLKWSDIPLA